MKKKKKDSFLRSPLATVLAVLLLAVIVVLVIILTRKQNQVPETIGPDGTQVEETVPPTSTPQVTALPEPEIYDPSVDTEEENNLLKAEGSYDNSQTLSVNSWMGMTLTIGLGNDAVGDALYINPHFTYDYAGNPKEQYGYLLQTNRMTLEYADDTPAAANDSKNAGITDLAIRGRTYDKVVPAVTRDSTNYGVRWYDSPSMGGKEHDGDTLHILTIRLSDGTLMCAAKVDIVYNDESNTYRFENFTNNDVQYTGALTGEQREKLVDDALTALTTGNDNFSLDLGYDNTQYIKSVSVVEKVDSTYWNRLFNTLGTPIARGSLLQKHMYAVDLNIAGIGFFTVYFMPEPMARGINQEMYGYQNEINLVPAAYDAFAPMSVDTFNSFLTEEEAAFFGANKY